MNTIIFTRFFYVWQHLLKIGLITIILFLTTQTTKAQSQLAHWPLFQPSFAEIEIDFTGASTVLMPPGYPTSTDKNNTALTQYRAMNSFHDGNGNLLFFVVCDDVDTYVYDAFGVKLLFNGGATNHIPYKSSSEIGIVPVPNTCLNGFHILVGGEIFILNLSSRELIGSNWKYSDGINLNISPTSITLDYPIAISRVTDSHYSIYSLEGNRHGSTTSAPRRIVRVDVDFCLGNSSSNYLTKYTVRNISYRPYFIEPVRFSYYSTELEISPDGKYIGFADNSRIFVVGLNANGFHNGYDVGFQYPNTALIDYRVGGLEFSTNHELVFSYFDMTIGSTLGGVGIWDFQNQSTGSIISGTSDYGRSQLEMGRDGKIYVSGSNSLDIVDINSASILPTSILAGPLALNHPAMPTPAYSNSIRTLPDQIDGYNYLNFSNNPNFQYQGSVHNGKVCYGSTAELIHDQSLLFCGGFVNLNSLTWNPPVANTSQGLVTTYPLYGNTTFTASFTNAFGCVVEEVFHVEVTAPPFTTTQNVDICEGDDFTVLVECSGSSFEWLAPASMIGSTSTFKSISGIAQSETYSYRCLDSNGCELYTANTHLNVISPPLVVATSIPICEGQSVNLNDYAPGGFTCSWIDDATGLPILNPIVSPSQSTLYTASCTNFYGCEVNPLVYVEIVQEAIVLPYLNIDACEGELVDLSFLIPTDWILNEVIVNGNIEVHRYESYDINGCLSYNDITINYLPKTVLDTTIFLNCEEEVNLDFYSTSCNTNALSWVESGSQNPIFSPLQYITGSISFTGSAYSLGQGCCEVNLHFEIVEPEVLEADLCLGGLPSFPCISDNNAEWFKDGVPYPTSVGFAFPGEYRILCKNNQGCTLKEYVFNVVGSEIQPCFQQWICYYEGMDTTLVNPCDINSTVFWLKDGQPYSMQANFSITPNGVGSYAAYCVNSMGDTTIYRYQLYDCQRFYKKSSESINTQKANKNELSIYPNPSEGIFNIERNKTLGQNSATLFIRDHTGRLIRQQKISAGETTLTIDLSNCANGIYLLTYKSDSKLLSKKITVL